MASTNSPLRAFPFRLVVALAVTTSLMVVGIVGVNLAIDSKLSVIKRVDVAVASAPPEGANYLLIGSDTRSFVQGSTEEEAFGTGSDVGGQRSDTMMVIHVEPGSQQTLAVSFPRDLWVDIPGVGDSKINAAFNDGPDKTIETLKANYGIDINHYIEVDFESFRGIVNAIGSVPIYFPYPARDELTGLSVIAGGCIRLDGYNALAYVRSRFLEYYNVETNRWYPADAVPDINRIARQQDFLRRLAGIAVQKGLNNPLTANEIADQALKNLTVDSSLSKGDIFDLIDAFRTINPNDQSALDFQTLPWSSGTEQGQSVLIPKQPEADEMIAKLKEFGNAPPPATETVDPSTIKVKVLNASQKEGLASATLKELVKFGFKDGGTGNDDRGTIALTEIRFRPGSESKAKTLFSYVDPRARLVKDSSLKGSDVELVLGTGFKKLVKPISTSVPATSGTTDLATETPAPISNESKLGPPALRTRPC